MAYQMGAQVVIANKKYHVKRSDLQKMLFLYLYWLISLNLKISFAFLQ